jgi:Na+/H+ antiporter NhaD/arsenite permease-like protein
MSDGYYRSLPDDEKRALDEWLNNESDRADARADSWLENGLRLVLILNAGGVLSLITASGALIGSNRGLDALLPSAHLFLSGLVLAALGAVLATGFFNYFSKWTHDMHRMTVKNEITREDERTHDERMSKIHSWFQGATLIIVVVSFATFSKGAYDGVQAIHNVTTPVTDIVDRVK